MRILTAPALPPEVEQARLVLRRKMAGCGVDGDIFDTLWSCDVAPIFAALGGDGEPVAWGVGSRVVVIGKALNEGHNFVGRTGVVVEPIDHAKARWVRFDGDDNKTSVPMRYLAVARAATGDTGGGGGALIGEAFDLIGHVVNHARRSTNIDGTRRRLGDDEACGRNWIALVDKCEALLATRAATGGPDAR
jgi:hypothetical protein